MPNLLWIVFAATAAAVVGYLAFTMANRVSRVRDSVLDEVRRMLRGGVIDPQPGRGPQARGRLGDLEVTVDLFTDSARGSQSPMWRVLAVGPVRIEHPIEIKVEGWNGWIDSWLQLGETVVVPSGAGPELTVHSEKPIQLEHPVVAAMRRQGAGLGPGALHARPDLMRAEVAFRAQPDGNRSLFSYLHAMGEISERPSSQAMRDAARGARPRRPNAASPHDRR
jgi:hypothetical protein